MGVGVRGDFFRWLVIYSWALLRFSSMDFAHIRKYYSVILAVCCLYLGLTKFTCLACQLRIVVFTLFMSFVDHLTFVCVSIN